MTNTQRNSLALSILLLILLSIGLPSSRSYHRKTGDLVRLNKEMSRKIAALDFQLSMIDSLRYQYELQQELLAQQSKIIIDKDTPSITYRYLLKVLNWMGKPIPFDFALSEGKKKDTTYNEYVISGRTGYSDLVSFVHNIEHQRSVITVEELTIGADTIANSDSVSFSMIFRTHYKAGGTDPEEITKKKVPSVYTGYNSFKTRIYDSRIIREYDPALLDVNSATLIAITSGRIFIRDDQKVIRILTVGDKVRDGYLYSIDVNNGKAIFKLDQYGVMENHTVFLSSSK